MPADENAAKRLRGSGTLPPNVIRAVHIPNFTPAAIASMVGPAALQNSIDQKVAVDDWKLYKTDATAFQIQSKVHSSTDPQQLYHVRLGVVVDNQFGHFTLMQMSTHRGHTQCRCSCPAGMQDVMCKHVAAALLCAIPGNGCLGAAEEGVPEEVHKQAVRLQIEGCIQPTSVYTRAANHFEARLEIASTSSTMNEILAKLAVWGYISPMSAAPPP